MRKDRIVIVGAGIGGLAAAVHLVSEGFETLILERAGSVGGKLRQFRVGEAAIDVGPTVFTMRPVFEALFAAASARLEDRLTLRRADILARHGWTDGARLDLFADIERSAEAIAAFAGPRDAAGYRRFAKDSRRMFETLHGAFIANSKPNLIELVGRVGAQRSGSLLNIHPFTTMWRKLGSYFSDARLRQLFGRYATYSGSSPFHAPATLMLIAHVEREGVWLVEGGMHRIATALAELVAERGGAIRVNAHVDEILIEGGAVCGVRLSGGEIVSADAVICNGDVNAVAAGAFGEGARRAADEVPADRRSLSALTLAMLAKTSGFPLVRHNVFFSDDYRCEFDDIFSHRRLPRQPTVYVCAQDRWEGERKAAGGQERLFCIVNAPPVGDRRRFDQGEIEACAASAFETLSRCGLTIEREPALSRVTTPADFETAFPRTGGALYGRASHGWQASFRRAPSRSRIEGLYFAGGSVHPGAGLPMAALSGRLAAQAVLEDLTSQKTFHRVAISGGMSTA